MRSSSKLLPAAAAILTLTLGIIAARVVSKESFPITFRGAQKILALAGDSPEEGGFSFLDQWGQPHYFVRDEGSIPGTVWHLWYDRQIKAWKSQVIESYYPGGYKCSGCGLKRPGNPNGDLLVAFNHDRIWRADYKGTGTTPTWTGPTTSAPPGRAQPSSTATASNQPLKYKSASSGST